MSLDGTKFAGHFKAAVVVAELNVWVSWLNEMDHNDKHAERKEEQTCNKSMRTIYPVTMLGRRELRSLIQVEVQLAVEVGHQEKMSDMFRNLVTGPSLVCPSPDTVQTPKA